MRVDVGVDDLPERGPHGLVVVVVECLGLRGTVASVKEYKFFLTTYHSNIQIMELSNLSYLVVVAAFNRVAAFLTRSLMEAMVAALLITSLTRTFR